MLSVILYGRNDNYGYNLHKRAALSLNCMAEVLTDDNDEIIFVDYNTPDDYPTFPEAIADTLTPKARLLLRVIRVRPEVHRARFESRTHLKAIEPVSRNVAIRRSNPENRWILSTNTDIIFVPRNGPSITDAIAGFADGFYCAPRIEIPETLWESYNRLDPAAVIAETRHWGSAAHLDEIVFGSETILYDGPGDFQLLLRKDLFEIDGFHEGMLLGWHVDSNIFKRLGFVYESIGDAAPAVFGYHCDHTRQVTPAHAHRSRENDSAEFVDRVTAPGIPEQCKSWGLADLLLEEVRLDRSVNQDYRRALSSAISERLASPIKVHYEGRTFDQTWAEPEHVLPFLVDLFSNAPRTDSILWLGQGGRLLNLFRQCWRELGFTGKVIVDLTVEDEGGSLPGISAFVINFGVPNIMVGEERALTAGQFMAVAQGEARHQKLGGAPRRIVGVNTVNSRLDYLMMNNVGCAKTPFSTRLRHGFLLLDMVSQQRQNWTSDMSVGSLGIRQGDAIAAIANEAGPLAYGPFRTLWPGDYLATIRMVIDRPNVHDFWDDERRVVTIQLVLSEVVRANFHVTLDTAGDRIYNFPFTIANRDVLEMIQIRFSSYGVTPVVIHSIEVQPADDSHYPDSHSIRLLSEADAALLPKVSPKRQNWTRRMSVGRAGVRERDAIASKPDEVGDLAFGPYLTLSEGKYRARVCVTIVRPRRHFIWRRRQRRRRALSIELVLDEAVRQTLDLTLDKAGKRTFKFPFVISNEDAARQIQIRLKCYAVTPTILHSVIVERIDGAVQWLKSGLPIRLRPSQIVEKVVERELQ